jgi:hypothetical protein
MSCALVLLSLTGCGDDSSAGGGGQGDAGATPAEAQGDAPPVDACSLISDEEMAGILSEQLPSDEGAITVTSESEAVFDNSTCTYSWIRSTWSAGSNKEFTVSVFPAGDLEVMAGSGERTPIDGVGDEAFETFDNYYARVGDAVAHVVNLQETPEASIAVLAAAAGKL